MPMQPADEPTGRYNNDSMDILGANDDPSAAAPPAEASGSGGAMMGKAKPGEVQSISISRVDNGYQVNVCYKKFPNKKGDNGMWDERKPEDLTIVAESDSPLSSMVKPLVQYFKDAAAQASGAAASGGGESEAPPAEEEEEEEA